MHKRREAAHFPPPPPPPLLPPTPPQLRAGAVVPGGLVPPPPMPQGAPVRPRRKRITPTGSQAGSQDGYSVPPSPIQSRPGSSAGRPGSARPGSARSRPEVARDQFGAVIPGAVPPPGDSMAIVTRTGSKRRGGKARAAMMANFGSQAAALANTGAIQVRLVLRSIFSVTCLHHQGSACPYVCVLLFGCAAGLHRDSAAASSVRADEASAPQPRRCQRGSTAAGRQPLPASASSGRGGDRPAKAAPRCRVQPDPQHARHDHPHGSDGRRRRAAGPHAPPVAAGSAAGEQDGTAGPREARSRCSQGRRDRLWGRGHAGWYPGLPSRPAASSRCGLP